ELVADRAGERGDELAVLRLAARCSLLAPPLPQRRVAERLLFRAPDRLGLGEDALPLIPLARPRPLEDDGAQPGILARAAGDGHVAAGEIFQVAQVRA